MPNSIYDGQKDDVNYGAFAFNCCNLNDLNKTQVNSIKYELYVVPKCLYNFAM